MKCQRCCDRRAIQIAVENGSGIEIPCPDCVPIIEAALKRHTKVDLADALLRIGTRMSHLCMNYGSKPGVAPTLEDRARMLDLDESWHQVVAELTKLKADNAQDDD